MCCSRQTAVLKHPYQWSAFSGAHTNFPWSAPRDVPGNAPGVTLSSHAILVHLAIYNSCCSDAVDRCIGMTSPVLTFRTPRAILPSKSIVLRTYVLAQSICFGTLQVYDTASPLGVTEIGAMHLSCSRSNKITMLIALVEKAGNAAPKINMTR